MTNPNPTESTPDRDVPRRWYDLFTIERMCLVLIVLASALAMSPNVADPDLWGHVQFGRDVLTEGQIATTTQYSYTAEGYRWINHENLSEIAMAAIADTLGPLGLVFAKFLLSLFVILTVLKWNLRQGTGMTVAAIMTLLVAANLGYHWSIRPQLSSFVCFTLLILLLQFCFAGWRDCWHLPLPRKWFGDKPTADENGRIDIRAELKYKPQRLRLLWLAVVLFFLWANSHGGFVAGLCVFVAYMGMRTVEAICRGGSLSPQNAGWGLARRMSLMAVVVVMATLVNPYGPNLHLWLLESLGSPRPEINDWSNRELFSLVGMKLWLMVGVAGFALMMSRRKQDITHIVILALLLWQSIAHFRHVPFFAIAAGFWIGPHLQSAMQRCSSTAKESIPGPRALKAMRAALAIAILTIGGSLAYRLSDLQVHRSEFPVDAIDFMRQNDLHGRVVVTYDWAQYAIAALCSEHYSPDQTSAVAFDGRFRTCYPQSVVDMHFDFLYGHSNAVRRHRSPESAEIDPQRVLQHGDPDLVLLRRKGELTEQHMQQTTDNWVLLYQDAIAQVWGRRIVYDDPANPEYLPNEKRIRHNDLATDSVTWPAIRPRSTTRSTNPTQTVLKHQRQRNNISLVNSPIHPQDTTSEFQ